MGTCKSAPATQWWAHADQHQQHSDGHIQISTSNTVMGTYKSAPATQCLGHLDQHQQQKITNSSSQKNATAQGHSKFCSNRDILIHGLVRHILVCRCGFLVSVVMCRSTPATQWKRKRKKKKCKIQAHKRFKRTVFIRTRQNQQIFWVITFAKLQNDT